MGTGLPGRKPLTSYFELRVESALSLAANGLNHNEGRGKYVQTKKIQEGSAKEGGSKLRSETTIYHA